MSGAIQLSEERGVRYLHFGSHWVQGAMRMARPFALELEYTREMMLPLLLRPGAAWPSRALLIGLGAGSLAKFLWRHRPACAITVVETREDVVTAAAQFFRLPDDPARLAIEVADGAAFVAGAGPRYDLVLVDGYDGRGRVGALDTPSFYRHCRARLEDDGLVATNLLSRRRGVDASLARLAATFEGRAMALAPCASGNIVVLAARASELYAQTELNLLPTVERLGRRQHADGAPARL